MRQHTGAPKGLDTLVGSIHGLAVAGALFATVHFYLGSRTGTPSEALPLSASLLLGALFWVVCAARISGNKPTLQKRAFGAAGAWIRILLSGLCVVLAFRVLFVLGGVLFVVCATAAYALYPGVLRWRRYLDAAPRFRRHTWAAYIFMYRVPHVFLCAALYLATLALGIAIVNTEHYFNLGYSRRAFWPLGQSPLAFTLLGLVFFGLFLCSGFPWRKRVAIPYLLILCTEFFVFECARFHVLLYAPQVAALWAGLPIPSLDAVFAEMPLPIRVFGAPLLRIAKPASSLLSLIPYSFIWGMGTTFLLCLAWVCVRRLAQYFRAPALGAEPVS